MTKFNLDNALPIVKDERLYNLARAIGLREWHTSPAIQVDFETYFARQQERLLREAEALPPVERLAQCAHRVR